MIERRMTWGYWFFNAELILNRPWIETHPRNLINYRSFDCFHYRINGKLFKKDDKSFKEAYNKEVAWAKLKGEELFEDDFWRENQAEIMGKGV